jgi:hypothetical protein
MMRPLLAALIVSLAVAAPAAAQQRTPIKEEQLKSGTLKVKAGALLMATGVFLIVVEPASTPGLLAPSALGTGMGLVLWGAKQRSNALRPQLTFGATVGRSKALYFSRRW